jgi:hypothetical protein
MTTLLQKLQSLKNSIELESRFDMPFPVNANVLTKKNQKYLTDEKNGFRRWTKFKDLLKSQAKGSYSDSDLNFWIINIWGGIRTFKRTDRNIKKIDKFKNQLRTRKMSKDSFGTISSLSKISSLIDPDNFVIYDSRVIYAINWLILATNTKTLKFFPMPTGRNKVIVDFDMNTIIHLIHLKKYKNKEPIFYSYQEAYFKFCDLMKDLSIKIFGLNSKPYLSEMLLWTISDKEIFNELTKSIKVKLNDS